MGTRENLQGDFTIVVRPERGYNNVGSRSALQRVLRAMFDCRAVNITAARGENFKGNIYMCDIDDIVDGVKEGATVFCTFDCQENLEDFLRFMIEGDFGLSLVVQGSCERVQESLDRVGLKAHTTNHSLGVWGKTEKLHPREILEITTMCGHGILSPYLVHDVIERIKRGEIDRHEGSVILSKPCLCGIFNTTRAEQLLAALT